MFIVLFATSEMDKDIMVLDELKKFFISVINGAIYKYSWSSCFMGQAWKVVVSALPLRKDVTWLIA